MPSLLCSEVLQLVCLVESRLKHACAYGPMLKAGREPPCECFLGLIDQNASREMGRSQAWQAGCRRRSKTHPHLMCTSHAQGIWRRSQESSREPEFLAVHLHSTQLQEQVFRDNRRGRDWRGRDGCRGGSRASRQPGAHMRKGRRGMSGNVNAKKKQTGAGCATLPVVRGAERAGQGGPSFSKPGAKACERLAGRARTSNSRL